MRWSRIESMHRSADIDDGVGAPTADPLWMLGRQWQLGELVGDDAAQPASVEVRLAHAPLVSYRPEGGADGDPPGPVVALPAGEPLEVLVEGAQPPVDDAAGLFLAVDMGERLRRRLMPDHADEVDRLRARFTPDPIEDLTLVAADRVAAAMLARRGLDGRRDEGLQVPARRRKQRLRGIGTHVGAMSLIAPNALWAPDFQYDHTIDGRQVKLLNIIDEHTREALSITVAHAIDADRVVAVLDRLVLERGRPPAFVRFDHGPEFIATVVADWCRFHGTETVFIDPGSPWQNAWIESFNSRLRDELLNLWHFDSLHMTDDSETTPLPGSAVRGSDTGRPIMALLDLLGRRWTLRILWELRTGALGFRELQRRCDDMSSSMLSHRLHELRTAGFASNHHGPWQLTTTGTTLLTDLEPLYRFADGWAAAAAGPGTVEPTTSRGDR